MRLQDSVAEWADLDSSIIWNALWTEDGNVQTNAETDLMNFHPGNFTMDMSSVWSPGVLACADVCALFLVVQSRCVVVDEIYRVEGSKQR